MVAEQAKSPDQLSLAQDPTQNRAQKGTCRFGGQDRPEFDFCWSHTSCVTLSKFFSLNFSFLLLKLRSHNFYPAKLLRLNEILWVKEKFPINVAYHHIIVTVWLVLVKT